MIIFRNVEVVAQKKATKETRNQMNNHHFLNPCHVVGDISGACRQLKQPHSSADGVRRCCVTLDNSTYLRISCGPAPSVAAGCRGPAAIVTAVSQRTKIPLFQQTQPVMQSSGGSRLPVGVRDAIVHI